jgi:nitrogen regulatory protein P-II 1
MKEIVEIRAIVRTEMLDRVVHCLKESGVPRLTVTRVQAIGAGVDPASQKISFEEGSAYSDKAMVQFICAGERCEMFTELIARAAHTGRRGDGIVSVHPVLEVTKIRTGAAGLNALG